MIGNFRWLLEHSSTRKASDAGEWTLFVDHTCSGEVSDMPQLDITDEMKRWIYEAHDFYVAQTKARILAQFPKPGRRCRSICAGRVRP